MQNVTVSKHMKGVTELTLIADIKPGLVSIGDTRTYATRLRILLRTLFEIRRKGVEEAVGASIVGPLERLQTLHFVRWSIFDNDRKLMLAVTFDGSWEPYIRKIADSAGPLLDVILCNCEGYAGHSTDLGYPKFAEWAREKQVNCEFLFAGSSDTTIDDVRYLEQLERKQLSIRDPQEFDTWAAEHRVGRPDDDVKQPSKPAELEALIDRWLRALDALHELRTLYPGPDQVFLLRTTHMILHGFATHHVEDPEERKKHQVALDWFDSLLERPAERPTGKTKLENGETVQGNILKGYPNTTHGCLLLMQLDSTANARAFVRELEPTRHGHTVEDGEVRLNVAFTYRGLRNIGLPDSELDQLPQEFREGMEARAGSLGDVGPNHPTRWKLPKELSRSGDGAPTDRPVRLSTVDLVIQLQTTSEHFDGDHLWSEKHPCFKKAEQLRKKGGAHLLAVEVLRRKPVGGEIREHFGYLDGVSQPKPKLDDSVSESDRDWVPLGEMLLGYQNDRGDSGEVSRILENGTFLVIRKLAQNVKRFREVLEGSGQPQELSAKMMGRYPDGRAIVAPSEGSTFNDFDYASTANDAACPIHSHIRRANPRTGRPKASRAGTTDRPIPRIVRRGFSYGTRYDEGHHEDDRGLFFMAYNASIADQFEVIQRWLSGGNSTGGLSAHNDPFLGIPRRGEKGTFRYVSDDKTKRVEYEQPLVSLKWGMYLFVPSTIALKLLADPENPPQDPPSAEKGRGLIKQMVRLQEFGSGRPGETPEEKRELVVLQWKKLLEDLSGQRAAAPHIWAAIREDGGTLDTPYGVLVATSDLVMQVFADPATYSVREYWDRMRKSLGVLYLGMDPEPREIEPGADPYQVDLDVRYRQAVHSGDYAHLSKVPNQWVAEIDEERAFEAARKHTRSWLDSLPWSKTTEVVKLRELVRGVLAGLASDWFALPDGQYIQKAGPRGTAPLCPDDFVACAQYIFFPNPTRFVEKDAITRGQALLAAAKEYVASKIDDPPPDTLFAELVRQEWDVEAIAQALVGTVHGFVAPTRGSFISVLHAWISTETLWRLQQSLGWSRSLDGLSDFQRARAVLREALIKTMLARPAPSLLHRTAVKSTTLGKVEIQPGKRVVLGLVSAAQNQPPNRTDILFGGNYGDGNRGSVHPCAGARMAMGVLLGMSAGLLEYGTLTPERPLTLSVTRP